MSLVPEENVTPFDEELEFGDDERQRDTGLWDPEDDHVQLPEEEQAMHVVELETAD